MSGPALFFITAGLLLLILLAFFFKSSTGSGARRAQVSDSREVLATLQSALLPRELVERIFSSEDKDFVSREAPIEVQRMFHRERKTLALSWLRRTRGQVAKLMHCYLRVARSNTDLKPAVEIRLALEYVLFQLFCVLLVGLISLRGPVHTRRLVGFAAGFANQVRAMSEALLTRIRLADVERVEPRLTGGSTAN